MSRTMVRGWRADVSSLIVLDRTALRRAARAATVLPAVFAFADKVIGNPTTALFAAFGSFALLVLAQFSGPWRTRVLAYLALGCTGAVFITLGTLCSRSPWLATAAMAVVGFGVLFSGVFSGYVSAGAPAAILIFVLPATVPAADSMIPARLAGWGLASGASILAVMLLWPPRRGADLHHEAADAVRSVADVLDAEPDQLSERGRAAHVAVEGLERRLRGTQQRPTGPTGPLAALASLPGELDWLLSLLLVPAEPGAADRAWAAESEEAMAAAVSALRAGADRLEGREARPDFARLDAALDAVAPALVKRLPDLASDVPASSVAEALDAPFQIRAVTYSARQWVIAQVTEHRKPDHERIRSLAAPHSERDLERLSLRTGQPLERAHHSTTELVHPRVRELHLRFDSRRAHPMTTPPAPARYSNKAVLPIPGSPRTTNTRCALMDPYGQPLQPRAVLGPPKQRCDSKSHHGPGPMLRLGDAHTPQNAHLGAGHAVRISRRIEAPRQAKLPRKQPPGRGDRHTAV